MQLRCYKGLQEYLDWIWCLKAVTTVERGSVLQIVLILIIFFCKPDNFFANKYFHYSVISLYKNEVFLRE